MRPELTAEMVVDGLLPSAPAMSPDGRWVVYVLTAMGQAGDHPSSRLWCTSVDGGTAPWRLDVPPAHVSSPQWSADSGSVYFLSDQASPGTAQLHVIGRAAGRARALTSWASGILAYRPLVDTALVAIVATDEPTEEERRRQRARDDAKVRGRANPARLRLLDQRTGQIRTPAGLHDRHVTDVVQRPDGGPLAVLTWSTPELDPGLLEPALHLVDPHSWQVSDVGPVPADAHSLVWWRDADWHLTYLALTPPHLQAGTAVFDLVLPDTGPARPHVNLTEGLAACPAELVQVDQGTPLVLLADGLDTAIHRLVPDSLTLTELSRTGGLMTHLSTNRDGAVVAAIVSGATQPHDIHAGQACGPLLRRTDTRPELRDIRWGTQERLAYQAFDGLALDGLLVLPPGRSRRDGPFPMVTIVHGGPYHRYADEFMLNWSPSGQWLAHAGYAVFLPNPRGGQGHGHEFAAAVAGAVGQEEWLDILTGIDLLIEEGVADPGRLGIAGWSHGGFMAAWAIGQTDRFSAALMGAGISDWGMLAATGEWGVLEAALGGSVGWEGIGPYLHDKLSPVSYASSIRTPVLIVHGADDTNVPLSQSEYFHRALRKFGVEHEFVVYPRENHRFRERNHQVDLLRRIRAWFDRWLVASTHSS
ncbi:dipeptidyl aminopeptidase/acylaminoacyl peptidase [Kibdelosporangium banguiense]|uniref:Dipeptidyl aminopeptidase/acylaminoacyl peptidase n=1 Tax=Kibdelosporangium banguiense TaxID=1365924 RepID=A0ABS4TVK7_9PSEU|nr:S9 family peptidase [Kibdelosporangium banguiense]MBP2328440.1 dipeptidyl aminopeptidase/acylaminoacyl peptidase [Kibdelosporangium banguiense]